MRHLFLLLLLVGCQARNGWRYDQIPSKEKECTRLFYPSDDPIRGIDVEFLYNGDELITYLQVHSRPIASEGDKKTLIRLIAENKTLEFLADLHNGKQRVRLSKSSQEKLINFLKEGKKVVIEMKGYRQTLDPTRFEKEFNKLENPPFRIPFHLPI